MIVHAPNKTYDIPRPLLVRYFQALHSVEGLSSHGKSYDEMLKKMQDGLTESTAAHKAIYDHLGLDHDKREQFTEEGFITEAVQNWYIAKLDGKPEIDEITVTNVIETQTSSG